MKVSYWCCFGYGLVEPIVLFIYHALSIAITSGCKRKRSKEKVEMVVVTFVEAVSRDGGGMDVRAPAWVLRR